MIKGILKLYEDRCRIIWKCPYCCKMQNDLVINTGRTNLVIDETMRKNYKRIAGCNTFRCTGYRQILEVHFDSYHYYVDGKLYPFNE